MQKNSAQKQFFLWILILCFPRQIIRKKMSILAAFVASLGEQATLHDLSR
jgi:hypothetical protein